VEDVPFLDLMANRCFTMRSLTTPCVSAFMRVFCTLTATRITNNKTSSTANVAVKRCADFHYHAEAA
jgi:hypothetical protein